jgi:glycosyltransferase involved in cell wall biosynthesis
MFNSEPFIKEALDSVISQTHPVFEIICVDDDSSDHTVKIVQQDYPQVRLFKNSMNHGPAACRNLGIEKATGDAIAFLDADDYWINDKIEWQSKILNSETSDLVAGLGQYFWDKDHTHDQGPDVPHFNAYLGTTLIRKGVFDRIGNFNESMRLSEDQDWFLRAREAHVNIVVKDRLAARFRRHERNITKDLTFKNSGMIEAIKKSLDRRRAQGSPQNLKILSPENEVDCFRNDSSVQR